MNTAEAVVRMLLEEEQDHDESVLDLALDFIEEEVGRHDWIVNWCKFKQKYDATEKIREWLDRVEPGKCEPVKIFHCIDALTSTGGLYCQ